MKTKNIENYSAVAKFLHWSIALLIISNYILGSTLDASNLYTLHEQTGMIILILVILRIIWRINHSYPKSVLGLSKLDKVLSVSMHHLLYILMFSLPVSGIMMTQFGGYPISLFGVINIPQILTISKSNSGYLLSAHYILANGIIFLAIFHALAALKHQICGNKEVLQRMLPKFIQRIMK